MKPAFRRLTFAFVLACMLAATAHAACSDWNKRAATLLRQAWPGSSFDPSSLLLVDDEKDPIVGMWHVTFTAEGNEPGPPDNTPIDNALVTWHSDRTELMNSARPPQDGDFCMGVGKKTGKKQIQIESHRVVR